MPARVLGILPPHMEFPSIKRNERENKAPVTGMGNSCLRKRKKKYVQRGSKKVPITVVNLKAICSGITHDNTVMIRNGNGK